MKQANDAPVEGNNSPSGMPLPFDLLPIEGGRIKVEVRLQKVQDVIDAALIDEVKDDPRWRGLMSKPNAAGDTAVVTYEIELTR